MSIYYYVYRITNIVENKHYYGKRTSKIVPILDIGNKYYSSSRDKEFMLDQKLNPHNYKYKVVQTFKTKEETVNREIRLHKKFNVKSNTNFYNKANQTSTKFDTTGISNEWAWSEESKKRQSVNSKGRVRSEDSIRKQKETVKNNPKQEYSIERRRITTESNKNRKCSDETRKKLSIIGKGRKHSDESKKKIAANKIGVKKSESCRKLMSHNSRKNYYVTPHGTVDALYLLEPLISKTQLDICTRNVDKIINRMDYGNNVYLYSNYTLEEVLGKTFKELGFNKIKKDKLFYF